MDTRGDPADAVPAVNQMFASTPGLALVIGCTSDEAASVAPVINAHKMAMFCMTGQSEFDHVHYPYFYRLVPPDLEESYAMVAIAQQPCTTSGSRWRSATTSDRRRSSGPRSAR